MKRSRIALTAVLLVAGIAAYATYQRTAASSSAGSDAAAPIAGADTPQPAPSPTQPAPQSRDVNDGYPFGDTSILRAPAGAKVAIIEFQDLQCPACAHAFPIVHAAVARHHIPLIERDYPLSQHEVLGSLDAAITARYLQDKVSPSVADDFRRDVFANQRSIANKDDMAAFTRRWFQAHGQILPFVIDATGACRNEVEADRALGQRLNIQSTPCIFVVTGNSCVPVPYSDVDQIDRYIDTALAQAASLEAGPRIAVLRAAPARA